jgi:DNA-binding CsgD family transcriptional regulator
MAELSKTTEGSDGVERALMQVRDLIESAVSIHRDTPAQPSPMVLSTDGPAVRRCAAEVLKRARHTINIMLPGTYERAKCAGPLLGRVTALANAGIRVRMLCTPAVLAPLGILEAAHRGTLGHEVRVTDTDLRGTVVSDGILSLGVSGPEENGRYLTINEDPATARALDLMFAGAWGGAMPLQEHLRLSERLHSDSVRIVLQRLREGHTDDVAAKQIRVSLRTYRRHVAAIMRDVGANSRFQAGVRAVELGLLPAAK